MGVAAVLARPPVAATEVGCDGARRSSSGGSGSGSTSRPGSSWPSPAGGSRSAATSWRSTQEAAEVSLGEALALSLLVMVPAEELFWRGLFQARLDQSLVAAAAGAWTWLGVRRCQRRQRQPADRRRRPGRGRPVDRPRRLVGRGAREPGQPYALDGSDAGAPAGSRARRAHGVSFLSTAVQQVLEQGSFCAVASVHATRPALHAAGVRVLGRPGLAHHVPEVRQGAGVEARPGRCRAGPLRGAVRVVHRHRPRLRRARPEHVGPGRGERDLDRPRGRRVQQEEREVLRRLRVRRATGAVRVDAAGTRVRGHRPRADRAARRGRCAGRPGTLGGRGVSHATFRSTKGTDDPLAALPPDMRADLGSHGNAALDRSAGTAGRSSSRPDGVSREARCTPRYRPRRWRSRASGPTRRSRSRSTRHPSGGRATWWGPCPGHGAIHVLDGARLRCEDRARAGDLDRPGGRRAASASRPRGWSGGGVGPAGVSPSRDDRRVLGGGRRVAGARVAGHEQPRQPPPLGQAHRVRRCPRGRPAKLGVRYLVMMRFMSFRTTVGAEVLEWEPPWRCGDPPDRPARGDRHDHDRARCRSNGACCDTRSTYRFRGPFGGLGRPEHPGAGWLADGSEARRAGAEGEIESRPALTLPVIRPLPADAAHQHPATRPSSPAKATPPTAQRGPEEGTTSALVGVLEDEQQEGDDHHDQQDRSS